jgi:hypothetical protein
LESDDYFRPTYDNWYFKDDYPFLESAKKSLDKAIEYISGYSEPEYSNIRYTLVLDV